MDSKVPLLLILPADPRSEVATGLLRALSRELSQRYDRVDDGSGHFQPEDVLVAGGVFLIGTLQGRAVACGAFRPLEDGAAEVKRMYVQPDCRGRGHARGLLAELERRAAECGYQRIRLETGLRQPEAIALYERAGYRRIGNFGVYLGDPRSVCFEKSLAAKP
ncbi:MAG TPA: GNAT family N-acetyltransferase [Planctomycetota bacterium]|jgi:ribosomal protein S18 acetylase RimI-like enzyme|nr:GNAT family N-acetyltransferase [Planctomycetota bacterium]